jgi:putative oxidoreductase
MLEVDNRRLLFPQLAGIYRAVAPFPYAIARFATGAVLVPHGFGKIVLGGAAGTAHGALGVLGPVLALMVAYAVGMVELFGAAFLAIGFLTRLAALSILVEMAVIVFVFLWPRGYFWTQGGYEYALLWGLLAFAFLLGGGGRYSVDRLLPREL